MTLIPIASAVLVSLAATVFDVRTRRIPNALTFGAAAAAVLWFAATAGLSGFGASLTGWIVGVALFFPFFAVGGMGAGDVKLVGAIGAWLGPAAIVTVVIYSALAGGVLAIALMLLRHYTRTAARNLWLLATSWRLGVFKVPGVTLEDAAAPRLAYAVPIAIGTVVSLCLR